MKSMLARLICAAAALRGVSVDELAAKTGLSASRVSQLRSGARADGDDATVLLRTLGTDPDSLIKHLSKVEARTAGQLDEAMTLLLLAFDQEQPPLSNIAGTVCCDKLGIVLPEAVLHRREALIARALAKGDEVKKSNHTKAVMYRGVFIGIGIPWKPWRGTGIRIEFNPARASTKAWALVASLVRAARSAKSLHVTRVDVAVDLSVPMGWFQPLGTPRRKTTSIGIGRRIETIYVGDKRASLSFAVYDKSNSAAITRIEARHKKRVLRPEQLLDLPDPFKELRVLWLGGEGLEFEDRVLIQLARTAGWPLLARNVSGERYRRLVAHAAAQAGTIGVPHPSVVFASGWPRAATRILSKLGLRS